MNVIVGYHIIIGMYGFWLPNDPRGSWSDFVGAYELFRAGGRAHKATGTKSVAHVAHDRAARLEAKDALSRPPVQVTGVQAQSIAVAMGEYLTQLSCPTWAFAILPDHLHMVIGRPPMLVESLGIHLKGAATRTLVELGIHPCANAIGNRRRPPKCFARGQWSVFLDPPDIARAVRYVEENPKKDGMRPQRWSFVIAHPY